MAARGQLYLRVGDRDVTLRFSARALGEVVEKQLGKPVAEWITQINQNFQETNTLSLGFRELAIFIQAGMEVARIDAKSGGRPVTMDDAYAIIEEVGLAAIATPVITAVAAAMSPPPTAEMSTEGSDPNG